MRRAAKVAGRACLVLCRLCRAVLCRGETVALKGQCDLGGAVRASSADLGCCRALRTVKAWRALRLLKWCLAIEPRRAGLRHDSGVVRAIEPWSTDHAAGRGVHSCVGLERARAARCGLSHASLGAVRASGALATLVLVSNRLVCAELAGDALAVGAVLPGH